MRLCPYLLDLRVGQLEIPAQHVPHLGRKGFVLEVVLGLALHVLGRLPGLPGVGELLRAALAWSPLDRGFAIGAATGLGVRGLR